MLRIADIELIPTCRIPSSATANQEPGPDSQSFEETKCPDQIFCYDIAVSPLLDTNFLQPSERLIICGQHLTTEQAFEAHFLIVRWPRWMR